MTYITRSTACIAIILSTALLSACRRDEPTATRPSTQGEVVKLAVSKDAEAGCGLCIYQMKEAKGCEMAVKIDGKTYMVEGKTMEDLGDPHAPDGLCNVARPVHVEGHIEGDRFIATKIELKPGS